MGGIFMSYRREDSRGDSGRLYDRLVDQFGRAQIFRDIDAIAPGDRFPEVLEQKLKSCNVLLAVIGPKWLDGLQRRLDDPADYVRIELSAALARDVPIIPVLVGGEPMPRKHELPALIEAFAECQAAAIREDRFHQDVDSLIDRIVALAGSVKVRRAARRSVDPSRPWAMRDGDWFATTAEPLTPPLILEWPSQALPRITSGERGGLSREINRLLEALLQRLWYTQGVLVPGICMMESPADGWEYTVRVFGQPLSRQELYISYRFYQGAREELEAAQVGGMIDGVDPVTGGRGYWISAEGAAVALELGWLTPDAGCLWETLEYPIRVLESQVRRHLPELIGHQECANLVAVHAPDALHEVVSAQGVLSDLVLVCRALLAEKVSLEHFDTILDIFLRLRRARQPLVDMVEEIRASEPIRRGLPGNAPGCALVALDADYEDTLARSLDYGGSQVVLSMEPEIVQQAVQSLRDGLQDLGGAVAIVVTNPTIRPFVRKFVSLEFPYLHVISQREALSKTSQAVIRMIPLGAG